jgi:uncharacterized membrane protein
MLNITENILASMTKHGAISEATNIFLGVAPLAMMVGALMYAAIIFVITSMIFDKNEI